MTKRKSLGWRQLTAAGFTVHKGIRHKWDTVTKWYSVTAPDGTKGHVLRQSSNKWHFFWDEVEATGSGGTPEQCMDGGLGDVIDTDGQLNSYKKMLLDCPPSVLRDCAAAYRASSDVYNA